MFNIEIKTLPAHMMRYPTLGDYYEGPKGITFAVCDLGNWKFEALVAIHELAEYILISSAGIKIGVIDEFDMQFEAEREMGIHGKDDEPGDSPEAPYHLQHSLATAVERAVAAMLGVAWADYTRACEAVFFPTVKEMKKRTKKR